MEDTQGKQMSWMYCINNVILSIAHATDANVNVYIFIDIFVNVCCTQEHDGDDTFYIREFHIPMRHYVY